MTDDERRKRADAAWAAMRRSHRKQAQLLVRAVELELASLKAQIECERHENLVQDEFERGQRAFHTARALTHEEPGARAEHARKAAEKREKRPNTTLERLEKRLPEAEAELARRRAELAELRAEERAAREYAKAMRVLYGSSAGGQRA